MSQVLTGFVISGLSKHIRRLNKSLSLCGADMTDDPVHNLTLEEIQKGDICQKCLSNLEYLLHIANNPGV